MTVCINLIPIDLLVARRLHRRRRGWIAACILTALAGCVTTAVVRTTLRDPRGLAEELDKAQLKAQSAADQLDQARAALRGAQQKLQAVGGLADRPDWSVLLELIAGSQRAGPALAVPPHPRWAMATLAAAQSTAQNTVIDSIAVKKAPAAAPPPGSPPGTPGAETGVFFVAIRGRGENQRDITSLALRLEDSRIFRTVRQGRVQQVRLDTRDLLEFEFTCELGPSPTPGATR